jgi:hypothetical protein
LFESSSPPYYDLKSISTFINPVTPPISLLIVKPLIKLASPSSSGVVPTSKSTQNYGFKYRQKP